jgi:hypothetical protein
VFRHYGGFQLTMPALGEGQILRPENFPALFKDLLTSILIIFQGEQLRVQDSGVEVVPQLVQEFISYTYNKEPFRSHSWTREMKPLEWWMHLSRDSNAHLLAVRRFKLSPLNSSHMCCRKSQSRYSQFLLPRSAMSALPHALDGLMQHAEVQ